MGGDLAQPRTHGEGDLHHVVEGRLVGGGAEGAFIFRLVEGLQRGVGVEHAATAAADDVPGHLEEADPRRMQQGGDEALLLDPGFRREVEGVDLVERVIGRIADHLLDRCDGIGIGRLPQDSEQGCGFAHGARG